jgi:hypothetical protein
MKDPLIAIGARLTQNAFEEFYRLAPDEIHGSRYGVPVHQRRSLVPNDLSARDDEAIAEKKISIIS